MKDGSDMLISEETADILGAHVETIRRMPPRGRIAVILSSYLAIGAALAPVRAAEPLKIGFNNRPPFHYAEAGDPVPRGLVADIVVKAIREAGLDASYLEMEASRIIAMVKGDAPFCSFSWFRNEERLQFAKFSQGIIQDDPFVVVTKKEHSSLFKEARSIADVFSDPHLRFGTGSKTSYGAYLDNLKRQAKLQVISLDNSQINMIKMLDANRFHFMILLPVEIKSLFQEAGVDLDKYVILNFDDIPKGDKRRIMCSKAVPDETIQRINGALSTQVPADMRD